jgi:hypothetical protein
MALTNEQSIYITDGINALYKSAASRTRAQRCLDPDSDIANVLICLDKYLGGKSFVASASASGILTPTSVMWISNTDISSTQSYVGYTSPVYTGDNDAVVSPSPSPSPSPTQSPSSPITSFNITTEIIALKQKTNTAGDTIGTRTLSGFKVNTLTEAAMELQDSVEIISSVVGTPDTISGILGTHKYVFNGTPKDVYSCTIDNNGNPVLGDVITQGNADVVGLLKTAIDCAKWANNSPGEAHIISNTGDVYGCGEIIDPANVWTECFAAVDITISYP